MAILVENKNMGGGHWYKPDGTPLHQVPKADGSGMRDTTLADARKLGLLPSVTGITDIVAKPALMNWKAAQVAAAAFEKPPTGEESAEYFIERVINASHHQVAGAADLGSKVHDALEKLLTHGPDAVAEDMWAYVAPVVAWKKESKITYDSIENVLVNLEVGYAGRCDVLGHDTNGAPVIIDYKTRTTAWPACPKSRRGTSTSRPPRSAASRATSTNRCSRIGKRLRPAPSSGVTSRATTRGSPRSARSRKQPNMKRPARRFVVREQTFGLAVEFFCGTPQSTALRRCVAILQLDPNDPENAPDEGDAAWAMCFNSHAVVWIEDAADIGSLVHELYHVTAHVLRHIESNDEETGAYIQQYLFREAWLRLNKKPKNQP